MLHKVGNQQNRLMQLLKIGKSSLYENLRQLDIGDFSIMIHIINVFINFL